MDSYRADARAVAVRLDLHQSPPVTLPISPSPLLPPEFSPSNALPTVLPQPPASFALDWLLDHASPPIQYRALTDVAGLAARDDRRVARLPFASRQAWTLLYLQRPDGRWGDGILTVPDGVGPVDVATVSRVGLVPGVRRLLELGWPVEVGPVDAARRLLFRLLPEDDDPAYLFEFADAAGTDEALARQGRQILREAAAATLAQAGFQMDPRLRGAAKRILARLSEFLRSPLADKPFQRVGNQHIMPAEASPPSYHTLVMLAHMPHLRSEHHDDMERLYTFLANPLPRTSPTQQVGDQVVEQHHLVLGDVLHSRNAMDADMPTALAWLELMARFGFLKRHEGWTRLLDRCLDDRDRQGVWHPPRSVTMPERLPDWVWPTFPLTDSSSDAEFAADVTFRVGLIAQLAGRTIEPG